MQPIISVIMPIYNEESSIELSIESVLNQSFKDFELILINDGSQDNSAKICNNYSKKDCRVIVINQKNQGVSIARNKGLEVAKGKYINFIDSDDTIKLDSFKILVNNLKQNDWDMIIYGMSFDYYNEGVYSNSDYKLIDKDITINKDNLKDYFFYLYEKNYLSSSCNKFIKRSILIENNISFSENMSILEDFKFTMDTLDFTQDILAINKPLYEYYNEISLSSFSRRPDIDYIRNFNILDNRLRKTALNFGLESNKDIEKINCMIIRYYIIYLEFLFYNNGSLNTKYRALKDFINLEEVIKSSNRAVCTGRRLQIINFLIKKKMKNLLFIAFHLKSILK